MKIDDIVEEKKELIQELKRIGNRLGTLKKNPAFIWRKREKKVLGYKKSFFRGNNLLKILKRLRELNEMIGYDDYFFWDKVREVEDHENLEIEELLQTLKNIFGTYRNKRAYLKEGIPEILLDELQQLINELRIEVEDLKKLKYEFAHNKKPVIVWGEHRSSELVALGVYELLAKDPELKNKVKFVEYKHWRISDYFSAYNYIVENYIGKNLNNEQLFKLWLDYMAQPFDEYNEELVRKYGNLIFNLHDGPSLSHGNIEVHFAITSTFEGWAQLDRWAHKLAKKFNLNFIPVIAIGSRPIYVEFHPMPGIPRYFLPKDNLYKKFLPEERWRTLQAPNTKHPLYKKSVKMLYLFMKELLLELTKGIE